MKSSFIKSRISTSALKDKTGNQVNIIHPYRTRIGWSFDDKEVGLQGEPFVLGTEKIIDKIVGPGATKFTALISHSHIPDFTGHLKKLTIQEMNDRKIPIENWYKLEGTDSVGWLCPATLKYFKDYPQSIYFKIVK